MHKFNDTDYRVVRTKNMMESGFHQLKQKYIDRSRNFHVTKKGNTYRLYDDEYDRVFTFFGVPQKEPKIDSKGEEYYHQKGLFLISMVKREVAKWVEESGVEIPESFKAERYDRESVDQYYYNFETIASAFVHQSPIITFDVNRCYWTTLYNLGMIQKSTYDRGLSDPDFKESCNMAIGSLASRGIAWEYEEGLLVAHDNLPYDRGLYYCHYLIRSKVESFMNEFLKYKSAFTYFYVDCVGIDKFSDEYIDNMQRGTDVPSFIDRIFKKYGYEFKKKYVKITAIYSDSIIIQEEGEKPKPYMPSNISKLISEVKKLNPKIAEPIIEQQESFHNKMKHRFGARR